MNKALEFVKADIVSAGFQVSNDIIVETLLNYASEVYTETISEHRRYDRVWKVVKLDDRLLGFETFHTSGDAHWKDLGLEHNWDKLCFVEAYEVVATKYRKVEA